MSRYAALFSIGFWSMASVMILMAIAADSGSAMPSARAASPSDLSRFASSQSGIDYRGRAQ